MMRNKETHNTKMEGAMDQITLSNGMPAIIIGGYAFTICEGCGQPTSTKAAFVDSNGEIVENPAVSRITAAFCDECLRG